MISAALLLASALATTVVLAQSGADPLAEARRLLKQGQHEQALASVDAQIARAPRDAQGRFLKGLILTEQNRSEEAVAVFTQMTEDFPELPEPYNNLAVLHAQQKQYDKARAALEMAIRTHPAYAIAHENLGDVYAKLASQAYDKALQIDSGNSLAQSKLSLIRELISVTAKQSANAAPTRASIVTGTRLTAADVRMGEHRQAVAKNTAEKTPTEKIAVAATVAKPATKSANAQVKPAAAEKTAAIAAADSRASPGKTAVIAQAPVPAAQQPSVTTPTRATPRTETADLATLTLALEAWAEAWSRKDVSSYLAHYADDFAPGGRLSREQWAQERALRVGKPGAIEVNVRDVRVTMENPDRALLRFRQEYRSSNLNSNTSKTLLMQRDGERWLIVEERLG